MTDVCAVCRKSITWGEWFIDDNDGPDGLLFWVTRHLGCEPKS